MSHPPPELERAVRARDGKQVGDEIRFQCPYPVRHHNGDANPSARYNLGKGVWFCDVCGAGDGWFALCKLLGVPIQRETTSKPEIVARYVYRDEQGATLRRKLRWQPGFRGKPKSFSWEKPGVHGGWVKCKGDGNPKRLYGSEKLPAARECTQPVLVVEGEKDADTVSGLGLVAVCNPEGAGLKTKWLDCYSEQLRDLAVAVIADKDIPGRGHAAGVALSLHGRVASLTVVELPGDGVKDLTDWVTSRKRSGSDLEALRSELAEFVKGSEPWSPEGLDEGQTEASEDEPDSKVTQAQQLAELASGVILFHTPDGDAFASITVDAHVETWPIRSQSFRRWLSHQFYKATGKPPGTQPLKDTLDLLGARAQFDGDERTVHTRSAGVAGRVYLDLADSDWRHVEVTATDWSVATDTGVHFVRSRGMKSIPPPFKDGDVQTLQRFINVPDEADFMLVVAWLLASLRPTGPFPILVLQGEQGSAKSTTARILRSLVDPATSPIRSAPRDEQDLMIAARNAWVLAFDNLSSIPNWLSDAMCRLATGGGFATRQLYTDADETILDAQRPLLLNGIDELTRRQDLLDRSIIVQLPSIPENRRKIEDDLWVAFEIARPQILGALLTAVSTGLRRMDEVKLDALPRMADFAKWVTAAEPALPWPEGSFLAAYANNREESVGVALESDLVAAPVISLLAEEGRGWTGSATELLAVLEDHTAQHIVRTRAWPKNARVLSGRLRRAATFLRTVGVEVEFSRSPGRGSRRVVAIREIPGFCVATVATGETTSQVAEESMTSASTQSATQIPVATQSATQMEIVKSPDFGCCDASDGGDAKSRGCELASRVGEGVQVPAPREARSRPSTNEPDGDRAMLIDGAESPTTPPANYWRYEIDEVPID